MNRHTEPAALSRNLHIYSYWGAKLNNSFRILIIGQALRFDAIYLAVTVGNLTL